MKAELINHMGSDLTVVNAARVSFDKESAWEIETEIDDADPNKWKVTCIKVLSERDQKLIQYLAKNDHWTPFAHAQITMRETMPIFMARQRFKHMVGFVYNEVSRRYVDDTPEFFTPKVWRKRAENKKQGSSDEAVDHVWDVKVLYDTAMDYYNDMLAKGVCPEQARMVLPQSMMTSYYVTGSLAAWARAYTQRIHEHAQREWDEITPQWDGIIRPLFPHAWSALVDG